MATPLPIAEFVGRLMMLSLALLAMIALTACGESKTTGKRCGVKLDGTMTTAGSAKRLDYSVRTQTIDGRARTEDWRVIGSRSTALYWSELTPLGSASGRPPLSPRQQPPSASTTTPTWFAGAHIYAVGCATERHQLQASRITVG